ncbi:MAG: glycine zipper family protein [Deltaproteobacteria bacterium]|jgi:hypothetical protein|nr:glycine zipper family protein [Deltaproteobacteria bacterium]
MKMNSLQNRHFVLTLVFLFVASTFLAAGCGSKYGPKTVKVNYYPQCYQPIDQLRAAEEKVKKDMITGAALGAITGAVVGIASTGSARGAAVGAGIGLIAGLAGSYLISSAVQDKALKDRLAAYNTSMDSQTNNLNIAVKYAKISCDCYEAEYKKLNASYQRGQISKEEMLVRLKEIRDGNNDAITVLKVFKADAVKHTETFAQIYKMEQSRSSDKLSRSQINSLRKKEAAHTKAEKAVDSRLTLATKLGQDIDNSTKQLQTADKGHLLALSGDDHTAHVR